MVKFYPEAKIEMDEAEAWYEEKDEEKDEGVGEEFFRAIQTVIRDIQSAPHLSALFEGTIIRRTLVRRFPYAILYEAESSIIWIIAIMHLRRKPGYWQNRSPKEYP